MGHGSMNNQIYKTCKYAVPSRFPRKSARRLHENQEWGRIQRLLPSQQIVAKNLLTMSLAQRLALKTQSL